MYGPKARTSDSGTFDGGPGSNRGMNRSVLAVAAAVIGAAALQGQTPKWEAVSIRPTKDCGGPGPGAGATKDGKKAAPDGGGRPGGILRSG